MLYDKNTYKLAALAETDETSNHSYDAIFHSTHFFQQIVRNSDESPQNAINEATYITLITYFYNIQIYFETYL